MQDELLLSLLLLIIGLRGNNSFTFSEGERGERTGLADVQFAVATSTRSTRAGFYKKPTKYIEIVIN